ncbi:MAG: hypothetical protein ACR2GX_04940 [Candidatus Dormibacteria bacterium]
MVVPTVGRRMRLLSHALAIVEDGSSDSLCEQWVHDVPPPGLVHGISL